MYLFIIEKGDRKEENKKVTHNTANQVDWGMAQVNA
jgi:hypothetical protein